MKRFAMIALVALFLGAGCASAPPAPPTKTPPPAPPENVPLPTPVQPGGGY